MPNSPSDEPAQPIFFGPTDRGADDRSERTVPQTSDSGGAPVWSTPRDSVPAPPSLDSSRTIRPTRVGPGFWESLAWSTGLLILHVGIAVVAGIVLAVQFFVQGGTLDVVPPAATGIVETAASGAPQASGSEESSETTADSATEGALDPAAPPDADRPAEIEPDEPASIPETPTPLAPLISQFQRGMPLLMGLTGLVTCLYGLGLCRFRLGWQNFQQLGWQLPTAQHIFIVCLLVLPLSALCTAIQTQAFHWFPSSLTEMEQMFTGLKEVPFAVVILILAVAPAVGEELLFRGVIGRGLLSHYGLLGGMCLTSLLFGLVHINPAQVLGVIPLGFAMHCVYAATRSFWAPVLLHFLNNGLAAVVLKFGDQLPLRDFEDPQAGLPIVPLATAVAVVVLLAAWLWQTRIQFRNAAGEVWPAPAADCGHPPATSDFHPWAESPRWWHIVGACASLVGFLALMMAGG